MNINMKINIRKRPIYDLNLTLFQKNDIYEPGFMAFITILNNLRMRQLVETIIRMTMDE
jgi:hypothetical protein